MADEFERFLARALAPEHRETDRSFVARVQVRIALDERLRAERANLFRLLGIEVVALLAVAAGLVWVARAAPVEQFFAESPAIALTLLLAGFGLLLILFSSQASERQAVNIGARTKSTT